VFENWGLGQAGEYGWRICGEVVPGVTILRFEIPLATVVTAVIEEVQSVCPGCDQPADLTHGNEWLPSHVCADCANEEHGPYAGMYPTPRIRSLVLAQHCYYSRAQLIAHLSELGSGPEGDFWTEVVTEDGPDRPDFQHGLARARAQNAASKMARYLNE